VKDMSNEKYEYDVALSYAGEDRSYAEALADILRNRGVHVFYDKYEKAILWGEDLYTYLSELYQNKSRYCILFLSKHYAAKLWTKHELRSAQARALREQGAYLLPLRLDDTEIPGVLPTIAYLDWYQETPETIADLIVKKLRTVSQASSTFAQRLSQESILGFINEATSKVVLILGRFTSERKVVLDALKEELSKQSYIPIIFDSEKLSSRDITETVRTLAHLARFIIADITDPSSIFLELQAIVPDIEVPVVQLLEETEQVFSFFPDFRKIYPWVLPIYRYKDITSLLASLRNIIDIAENKVREIATEKAKRLETP